MSAVPSPADVRGLVDAHTESWPRPREPHGRREHHRPDGSRRLIVPAWVGACWVAAKPRYCWTADRTVRTPDHCHGTIRVGSYYLAYKPHARYRRRPVRFCAACAVHLFPIVEVR